jgi:hypothetical protein
MVAPATWLANPRATSLSERKNLLAEFRHWRDRAIDLSDHVGERSAALANPSRPRPGALKSRLRKSQATLPRNRATFLRGLINTLDIDFDVRVGLGCGGYFRFSIALALPVTRLRFRYLSLRGVRSRGCLYRKPSAAPAESSPAHDCARAHSLATDCVRGSQAKIGGHCQLSARTSSWG